MGLSTVESVASFSVVLAEAFAAVGLATLVPASFVTVTRAAKGVLTADANDSAGVSEALSGLDLANSPLNKALTVVANGTKDLDGIDLLVPKTGKIHAEFEFQGSDSYSIDGSLGAQIEVVTVKAGMTALYSSSSKNKITLDVDFATAHFTL